MIDIHSIINALCATAYIALMFCCPIISIIFIVIGAARSWGEWWVWLVAVFIGLLPTYVSMRIHISQRVEFLGDCAFGVSCLLVVALLLYASFHRFRRK